MHGAVVRVGGGGSGAEMWWWLRFYRKAKWVREVAVYRDSFGGKCRAFAISGFFAIHNGFLGVFVE